MLKEIKPFGEDVFLKEIEKYIEEKGLVTIEEYKKKNPNCTNDYQEALNQQEILKTISHAGIGFTLLYHPNDPWPWACIFIQTTEGAILLSPAGIDSSIFIEKVK